MTRRWHAALPESTRREGAFALLLMTVIPFSICNDTAQKQSLTLRLSCRLQAHSQRGCRGSEAPASQVPGVPGRAVPLCGQWGLQGCARHQVSFVSFTFAVSAISAPPDRFGREIDILEAGWMLGEAVTGPAKGPTCGGQLFGIWSCAPRST